MIINVKDVVVQGVNITVPTWVNWVAVDKRGSCWGYELKPINNSDNIWWNESDLRQCPSQYLFKAELSKNEKWQDLLFHVGD